MFLFTFSLTCALKAKLIIIIIEVILQLLLLIILIEVIIIIIIAKSDHRSKFSNFKQLEGRSLKNIRASTGYEPVTSAEVMGLNPVEALIFCRRLPSNCLKLENLL